MKTNMTLGQLVDELEKAPPNCDIRFDFCDVIPGELHSSCGDYSEIAITPLDWRETKVGVFLASLRAAVVATFEGWKGGDYRMGRDTPVWVDEHGNWSGTAVVGVHFNRDSHGAIYGAWLETTPDLLTHAFLFAFYF